MTPPPHPGSSEMKVSQPKKKKRKKGKKKKKSRPMALSSHVSGPKSPVLSFKETEKNRGKKNKFFFLSFFFSRIKETNKFLCAGREIRPRESRKSKEINEKKTREKRQKKQTNKQKTNAYLNTYTATIYSET